MTLGELLNSLKGDCYRFHVHMQKGCGDAARVCETFFDKGAVMELNMGSMVGSFTVNPAWLACEDETQRCIMVDIYLES